MRPFFIFIFSCINISFFPIFLDTSPTRTIQNSSNSYFAKGNTCLFVFFSISFNDQSKFRTTSLEDIEMVVPVNNLNQPENMYESIDPPFEIAYKDLFDNLRFNEKLPETSAIEVYELPLIDLNRLMLGESEVNMCKKEIALASKEWGFFQVINHGISREILEEMRKEQVKLFKKPFQEKQGYKDLNFSSGSYRWGTPSPNCLKQLSWSEAFHVSLSDILGSGSINSLSSTMDQFATTVSELAHTLADILAEELGRKPGFFKDICLPSSCYLRLNRYPKCPLYPQMFGIVPHTDSDFLTVVHQDSIGGLQMVKDGRWIAVKPNPDALIINIGDLFQAWSNNVYKSVEHRVIANASMERFSTAYFFCPSHETIIHSDDKPNAVYRSFSFGEYRKKIQEDVGIFGHKIGLKRFLIHKDY